MLLLCGVTSFAAQAITKPGVPTFTYPDSALSVDTDGNYTVSWQSADGVVARYELIGEQSGTIFTGVEAFSSARSNSQGTYYYRIRACNSAGCSAYSAQRGVLVPAPIPDAPTLNVPAQGISGESYNISWSNPAGATSYRLTGEQSGIIYNGTSSSTIRTKGPGSYSYMVQACNGSGCSGYSAKKTIAVNQLATPVITPLPTVDYTGAYTVSWTPVAGATSYNLYENNIRENTASTSLNKNNPDGTYQYQVEACNNYGCGNLSVAQTIVIEPLVTPTITVSPTPSYDGKYTVSWSPIAGATSYNLYEDNIRENTASTYLAKEKPPGKYQYQIEACNAYRCSDLSPVRTATVNPQIEMSEAKQDSIWYTHDVHKNGDKNQDFLYTKYSGALGTYSNKHIPTAISGIDNTGKERTFYTFSDCKWNPSQGGFVDFRIYVAELNQTEKTLVRRINDPSYAGFFCDPHANAAINITDEGKIKIVAAARQPNGISSEVYTSKNAWDITFDSGDDQNGDNWPQPNEIFDIDTAKGDMHYPQLWPVGLIYSDYNGTKREPWITNETCTKKLVDGGHYNISYWDGSWLHMVYNTHERDSYPNGNAILDRRKNIYYMKTQDGCNWKNIDNLDITAKLPLYELDTDTLLVDTEQQNGYKWAYLKDITVEANQVKILAVLSQSYVPTSGSRKLVQISGKDSNPNNVQLITNEIGHNYDSGNYVNGYIVTPTNNHSEKDYAGGDLKVFDINGNYLNTYSDILDGQYLKYNYVKKVYNGTGAVLGATPSSREGTLVVDKPDSNGSPSPSTAKLHYLKIKDK